MKCVCGYDTETLTNWFPLGTPFIPIASDSDNKQTSFYTLPEWKQTYLFACPLCKTVRIY